MRYKASGFTLIELIVGMAIALLGSLAIMQAFTGREADRRAIGSLSDSQTSALIGLFMIERDLQQAGSAITDLRTLGCTVSSTTSALNGYPLVSVGIVPADGSVNLWNLPLGDANSDMILLSYGTSENTSEGQTLSSSISAGATVVKLNEVLGFSINDAVLLAQTGRVCTMGRVTASAPASQELTINTGAATAYGTTGRVFNLGAQPRMLAYAVRNGSLTVCNFSQADCTGGATDPTVWVPVLNDVVALHAQYGLDTTVPQDGVVDAYCQAVVAGACVAGSSPAPATACDFARIGAMYVGLVTRSPQAEKTEISPASIKVWADSATEPNTTGPTWPVTDRNFRYRVVSSSVALRNLQLMGVQSGC